MHWNTLNARLAKKSWAVTRPAAGRKVNPEVPEEKKFFVCLLWIVDKLKKNVAKYVQSTKTRFKRSLILQIKVRKKKQTFFKNFLKENFAENIWWMNDCLEQVDKFRYLSKHFLSIFSVFNFKDFFHFLTYWVNN